MLSRSITSNKGSILITYPTISKIPANGPIWAFDKLDGSNIRVEWTRKNGFVKFGSRHRLLDPEERPLGEAVEIFHETLADDLEPVLRKLKNERVTLFMEFFGENSFAGNHVADEPHKLVVFDASLYKKGFMLPGDFVKTFGDAVETPSVLHLGKANSEFQELVHSGELEGMTFEGVVCKSNEVIRGKAPVFKIKNQAWLDKLKTFTKGDAELYRKLA